jgi:hypothetical protein
MQGLRQLCCGIHLSTAPARCCRAQHPAARCISLMPNALQQHSAKLQTAHLHDAVAHSPQQPLVRFTSHNSNIACKTPDISVEQSTHVQHIQDSAAHSTCSPVHPPQAQSNPAARRQTFANLASSISLILPTCTMLSRTPPSSPLSTSLRSSGCHQPQLKVASKTPYISVEQFIYLQHPAQCCCAQLSAATSIPLCPM